MAELTYAQVDEILKYDPLTGVLTWRTRPRSLFKSDRAWNVWNARYAGKNAFPVNKYGYASGSIFKRRLYGHRVCWLLATGEWPVGEIDHIDRDRANNRLSNLREVSRSVNMRNKKRQSNNVSGLNGVTWMPRNRKWAAYINVDGKRKHLGLFASKAEAASARSAAAKVAGFTASHGFG